MLLPVLRRNVFFLLFALYKVFSVRITEDIHLHFAERGNAQRAAISRIKRAKYVRQYCVTVKA